MTEKVKVFDALKIEYGACPPGCSLCEEACARLRPDLGMGTIKAVQLPDFRGAMTCLQCGEPLCLGVCPTGAISKSPTDGVVRIEEEKCVGCALCTLVCPQGGIYYHRDKQKAVKCDRCQGEPRCLEACPYGLLSLVKNRLLFEQLDTPDIISPGTGLCVGCPAELALRVVVKVLGPEIILFGAPGCGAMLVSETAVPTHSCLLTNVAPTMEGVRKYYRHKGREVDVVAFVGDGATADAGFQTLSGAAERGEKLIYICYDNEAYMNTGVQRSSTTPAGTWTFTTPVGKARRGKAQAEKYMPLIMAFHGIPYAATATLAFLEDFVRKLKKAKEQKEGMAYIHLLCPCPTGWRARTDLSIEICRKAVETNYFPLWEWEQGRLTFTYEEKKPRPISDYARLMGKFAHLKEDELKEWQSRVDARYALLKRLAGTDSCSVEPAAR